MINTNTNTEDSPPAEFRLESPYKSEESERIHVFIGKTDVTFIRLIRPQIGTFTHVVSYLWKSICTELRQRNIIDHTSCTEFEQFLSNIKILPQDEYESLKLDAMQWQQHLASKGNSASGSGSASSSANVAGTKPKRRSAKGTVADTDGKHE